MKPDLSKIKLVATDCDGVLTDGGMYYLDSGDEFKKFHVHDGIGFRILKEHGIKTAIITTSSNKMIEKRANVLHVDFFISGNKDKLGSLKEICNNEEIKLSQVVYIGDDIYDVPAIRECGFGCAPIDAMKCARDVADYICERKGGYGCFREIVDMVIER